MKTAKNKEINREIAFLAALREADIDTSDTAEVTDWGAAKRGMFYERKGLKIMDVKFELLAEKIDDTIEYPASADFVKNFRGVVIESPSAPMEPGFQVVPGSLPQNREVLMAQIDKYLEVVASGPTLKRDRQIFWHYYRDGMTTSTIASLPTIALTQEEVENTLHRLVKLVREFIVKK